MKDNIVLALDSNIFIYSFEGHPQFAPVTKRIFEGLEKNNFTAVTSIISLTETLSFPMSEKRAYVLTDLFFQVPQLTIYEINQMIALEAARIRRKYKFRLPDAIQLATALYGNADSFITNDQKLQAFKEVNIKLLNKLSI